MNREAEMTEKAVQQAKALLLQIAVTSQIGYERWRIDIEDNDLLATLEHIIVKAQGQEKS